MGAMTWGRCPAASTVNKGWFVQVRAVDAYGDIDEFFDGKLLVRGGPGSGIGIATTAALVAGAPDALLSADFTSADLLRRRRTSLGST
jgi:hypothetical protein